MPQRLPHAILREKRRRVDTPAPIPHADSALRMALSRTISRTDAGHFNPRATWQALGEPGYLDAKDIGRISAVAALTDEAHAFLLDGGTTLIEVALQPPSLVSLRIEWGPC